METYIRAKPLEKSPEFQSRRETAIAHLDYKLIEKPLINLVRDINSLPFIFTLQCCHGHFLATIDRNSLDFDELASTNKVLYKLAYIAFCIDNSRQGRRFMGRLEEIPKVMSTGLVQFCSADWFWDQWKNSYVLQVMPQRFIDKDRTIIDSDEANTLQKVRDSFFEQLQDLAEISVRSMK